MIPPVVNFDRGYGLRSKRLPSASHQKVKFVEQLDQTMKKFLLNRYLQLEPRMNPQPRMNETVVS